MRYRQSTTLRAIRPDRDLLLRLRPDFRLAWMKENLPLGRSAEPRVYDAVRKAGYRKRDTATEKWHNGRCRRAP